MAAEKKDLKKVDKGKTCRENIRCRVCRVVDGYGPDETECRACGAKLFKGDVI
jgi:hypothetical protein